MNALLLTVPQAAQALAISRRTVYTLLDNGSLEAVRIGRAVRIEASALAAFIQDHKEP